MELNDGIADRFFPPEMRAVCPILQAVPIKVCVFGKKIGLTMLLLLLLLLLYNQCCWNTAVFDVTDDDSLSLSLSLCDDHG